MIRLLGRANSSNVMKVVWTLEEIGLPYRREDVGGPFGGTDTPEYGALNPNRVVPTLIDDDFVMWESNAIVRYLAARHAAGSALWPEDARRRADFDRWMDWVQTTLTPPMTVIFLNLIRTPPDRRDAAAVAAAVATLGRLYGMLDHQLAGHEYLCGVALTPADLVSGIHVHRWFNLEVERPDLPRLRAWYDRLLQRPAYREHVALPLT